MKENQGVIEIPRDRKPGVLNGIDSVFFQNAYSVTAVAYGFYPVRDPDPVNPAPLRHGDLHYGVHTGTSSATVDDVAELEKTLKGAIILRDIAGEDIFNSRKIPAHSG